MAPSISLQDLERSRNNPPITLKDAEAIRRLSPLVRYVMAQAEGNAALSYRNRTLETASVRGVSAESVIFPTFDIDSGRLLSPLEIERRIPVTTIGADVVDRLFAGENPLEKFILVNGTRFRVVGVHARKGALFGMSQDEFIVIPLGSYLKLFGTRLSLDLVVRPYETAQLDEARNQVTDAMRVARRLKPKQPNNFGLMGSDTFMAMYHAATDRIFLVLVGVVALSLVVGGIVIMNIMLMAVTARTQEIGLRKAIGARRRDIMWQILTESVTLSVVGGIIGTVLGFVVAFVIAALTPLTAAVEPWSVTIGVGVTAAVGLFFGLYPAMRAARLDPIEALRRE
jgi:putative ABC transport system permease protein